MNWLDFYCGAGGAAEGFHRSGFQPVGVDLHPQPRYPFPFIRGDALRVLRALLAGEGIRASDGRCYGLRDFVGAHASPPCQAFTDLAKQNKRSYPELIDPTRDLLQATGLPYTIENVEGAPLRDPIILCGTMFEGLRVIRHRLFESNVELTAPLHPSGRHPLVFTYDKRKAHYGKLDQDRSFVQVTGGGTATVANKADAMGIDWMIGRELNEAIPPAYAAYVGRQLRAAIEEPLAA